MRPTIIFFLSTLYLILVRKKIPVFAGFLVGTFLSLLYLIKNSLFGNFWNLAIVFNQSVYSHVQNQPINKRQIVSLGLLVAIFCFSQIQKNKLSATFLGLSSLVLVYPRFGLEHLQVFLFTFILLLSQANLSSLVKILTFSLAAVISLISWLSIFSAQYGNFFYPREIFDVAKKIKNLPGDTVYLYGASDLLYQLSGKTPTGKIYLPSLPWYLNHPSFQEKLFGALAANPGYVIVDPLFSVDNQKLITTTPQILSYIKMNYLLVDHIGQLEVYKPKYENRN